MRALYIALGSTLLLASTVVLALGFSPSSNTKPVLTDDYRAPVIYCPVASQQQVANAPGCEIDYSNVASGYVMVKYTGCYEYAFVIVLQNDTESIFRILWSENYTTLPLSGGSGLYVVSFHEPVVSAGANVHRKVLQTEFFVELDECLPYLYPNQMVWFTEDTAAIQFGGHLLDPAMTDLEVIEAVYRYTAETISVNYELERQVHCGDISERLVLDVDEIYSERSGVCLDYAVLMVALLRSQQIPTKLVVGYANSAWHSWVSVYTAEEGWVVYDPTFASDNTLNSSLNILYRYLAGESAISYEEVLVY